MNTIIDTNRIKRKISSSTPTRKKTTVCDDKALEEALNEPCKIDCKKDDALLRVTLGLSNLMQKVFDRTPVHVLLWADSSITYFKLPGKITGKGPTSRREFEKLFPGDWRDGNVCELGHETLLRAWKKYRGEVDFADIVEAAMCVLQEAKSEVTLLLGAAASSGEMGSHLDAHNFDPGDLTDLTLEQLRQHLPSDSLREVLRLGAELKALGMAKKCNPRVEGRPLRHAGHLVYPRENTPASEHAGRQFDIQCQRDSFTVVRGKGNRPQDRTTYPVPPALRAFVDDLLTAYETGAWTPPPDLGTDPKGKPRKWRQYAPHALLDIIQPEPNGKKGYTGNSRLWIE